MVQKLIRNKKGFGFASNPIIIFISLIAGLITILSFTGIIDTASITGSGSYIDRPVFYFDKCEAVGSYKYSNNFDLATNGEWLDKPSVTDKYDVTFNFDKSALCSVADGALGNIGTCKEGVNYYICNSKLLREDNCRIYNSYTSSGISNIKNDEYVWAQFQRITVFNKKALSGADYQIGFIPYGLRSYNILSGSSAQLNPNSCTYSSSQTDSFLSSDSAKVNAVFKGVDKSTNERVLQPNEVRWYVAGYLTSKAESFELRYRGYDAWCRVTGNTGEVYKINEITTNGGTYKIASADYSDYLGSVACCPGSTQGDQVCNDDFEWETIQGSECSIFKSCGSSNFVPYSENTLIKYSCVQGYCESETKDVECASDYDCKDANEVCDLNSYECVNANVNLDGQVIETIPDSESECVAQGGKWITKEKKERSLFNLIGFGEPDIIVEEYCDLDSGFNIGKILLVLGGIALLFILLRFGKPIIQGIRMFLKGLPLIGRIIP